MTTVEKAHELKLSFEGRSPRQIYADACVKLKCRVNPDLQRVLSDVPNDFEATTELGFYPNFFGPMGSLALLPLIQCHPQLVRVDLRGCGIDDSTVLQLAEVLQDHPRLREVDLSDNPDISVYSGKVLSRVCRQNVNLIEMKLEGTHIGRNVASVITKACTANREHMEDYFTDNYFRMKDMFIGLDVDGSGWVNITTFVSSVVFPWIQERLRDRIAETKPPQRDDHCIDINTFMPLVYPAYKTKADINRYVDSKPSDPQETSMVRNWRHLLHALEHHKVKCPQLSSCRLRFHRIDKELALKVVEEAAKTKDEQGAVTGVELWKAARKVAPGPGAQKRTSSFFLNKKEADWMVTAEFVAAAYRRFGESGESVPVLTLLEAEFDGRLHKVKLGLLRKHFIQHAIPMEETSLTIEEIVNMMNEHYEVIRVDKHLSLEEIDELARGK